MSDVGGGGWGVGGLAKYDMEMEKEENKNFKKKNPEKYMCEG